jgi:hypothetical protein
MMPNPESLEPRAHIRVVPGTQRAWKAVKGIGFEATCVTLTFLSPLPLLFLGDPPVADAMDFVFSGMFKAVVFVF